MSLTLHIDSSARAVAITTSDALDREDWRTCLRLLITDPRIAPGCRVLVDTRHTPRFEPLFVLSFLSTLSSCWTALAQSRWALLVSDYDAWYGPDGPLATPLSPNSVRIAAFTDLSSATAWLTDPAPDGRNLAIRTSSGRRRF